MPNGEVLVRAVPTKFRNPGHVVRGNLIFEEQPNGSLSLVGQLEELGCTESDNLAKLCGGDKGLQVLSAAGSVASVLNLGVSVLGFLHVSKLLRRIECRIERVEGQLEQVAELVGVMDQKVDQLIELSEAQTEVLSEVHHLFVSFQTAKVHAALTTLDLLSTAESAPDRDERLRNGAETLQVFRIWLADKRDSTAESAMAARAGLLRAELDRTGYLWAFPRTRGETARQVRDVEPLVGSSPHARGFSVTI